MPPSVPSHEDERIQRLRRAMYSRSLSEKIKEKDRRHLSDEKSLVGDDWVRPEPQMSKVIVAPFGIGITRVVITWTVLAAFAFFVGAAAFFAYYFLIGGGSVPASPGNIDISVSGPLKVSSGEPVELQVIVTNRNRTGLQLTDLVVKYPPGTRSPTDLITDLRDQRIPLGTLEAGGRRQGTVSAVLSGNEGEVGAIKVQLEYRLEGSSAIFVAESNYNVTFATSPLSISVEGNQETISGQPVELRVTVASNADAPLKDVLFSASYPFGFTLVSSEPKLAASATNLWTLGDLVPGQKKTIILRGTLVGEMGDERVFRFNAGTRRNQSEKTMSVILSDYAHRMFVSRPFLDLTVAVNRQENRGSASVQPGEVVTVTIGYINNLQNVINDAIIVARLSGVGIDGTTVKSTDGFYRSVDRSMLWDKSTEPGLASLAPGARDNVSFTFQVPSDEVINALRDPKLTITVHAAGKRVAETGVPESLQASATKDVRFATALELVAQGLYYTNPFGSVGPLPPKAGSETTYAVVFSITNTTSEIKNAQLKAILPPYVRWTGVYSPSQEKVTFNPTDSTFTWNIGAIAPGVGVGDTLPRQAAISIGFTPSTSQVGQQPSLVRGITLTGIDSSTGEQVSKTAGDVTTNIAGDVGFEQASANVVLE
jgi:hypothetical protein